MPIIDGFILTLALLLLEPSVFLLSLLGSAWLNCFKLHSAKKRQHVPEGFWSVAL